MIVVRDNGIGISGNATGIGVGNTRDRLEALYGAHHRFTLRNRESGGAEAEIILPYHVQPLARHG